MTPEDRLIWHAIARNTLVPWRKGISALFATHLVHLCGAQDARDALVFRRMVERYSLLYSDDLHSIWALGPHWIDNPGDTLRVLDSAAPYPWYRPPT